MSEAPTEDVWRSQRKMKNWKQLKEELQIGNIDPDDPKEFLHIKWSTLREILKKCGNV
jgi:hypothetical protein